MEHEPYDVNKFLMDNSGCEVTQRSLEFCGWRTIASAPNGVAVQAVRVCKKWRECENCYNQRKNGFALQLNNMPDDTVVIICDTDVAKKLLRKRQISSEDYFRSPINDGRVAIAISEILLDEVGFDNYLYIYDLKDRHDETAVVNESLVDLFTDVPENTRTSGKLGKVEKTSKLMHYEEPESEDDTVELTVTEIITEADEIITAGLYEQATIQTSEDCYQDRNILPIEDVYYDRQKAFESLLFKNGIEYHVLRRSVKLVSRKWMEKNFVFIKIERDVKITTNIDLLVLRETASRTYYRQISHYADMERQQEYAF